jgi:hypothetical protein
MGEGLSTKGYQVCHATRPVQIPTGHRVGKQPPVVHSVLSVHLVPLLLLEKE